MNQAMKDSKGRPIACGKCGSRAVYLENIPGTGASGCACLMCGNRHGSEWGFQKIGETKTNGGESIMVKIGKCVNCERDGVKMPAASNKCHQCNSYVAGTRDNPALRVEKLREAKELYKDRKPSVRVSCRAKQDAKAGRGKRTKSPVNAEYTDGKCTRCGELGVLHNGLCRTCKAPADTPAGEPAVFLDAPALIKMIKSHQEKHHRQSEGLPPDNPPSITLIFAAADSDLHTSILAEAQRYRRDPAQHILFLVERYLQSHQDILAGKIGVCNHV
jgi:hypothetical protein